MTEKLPTRSRKNKSKKKTKKLPLRGIALFIIVIGIISLVGCSGIILAGDYKIDGSKLDMAINSVIYDRNDEKVSELYHVENREMVALDKLPQHLQDAFVYTEDKRFFDHYGIDPKGIARAIYTDIKTRSAAQGASTITQQLARNAFLTDPHEKTLSRKFKEMLIAVNLERQYSKEQILEMYLNRIYFGHGTYGVQAAAQFYFGKDASELTVEESAVLAGLPKAPETYSPRRNPDKSLQRRNVVLQILADNGKLTQEKADELKKTEIALDDSQKTTGKELYQAYIDYIVDEASKEYNLTADEVLRGGYHIYTYLDVKTQTAMEETISNPDYFKGKFKGEDQHVQASMISVDPSTGGIWAIAGGRDYERGDANQATERYYQPGSAIKPIADYAPAFEEGDWHPYSIVEDKPMAFGRDNYSPKNYDGKHHGKVTLEYALQQSLNVPAVYLLDQIGVKTGYRFVESLGIDLHKDDMNLTLALGGLTEGASPLQMAQAYATFANNGKFVEAHAIREIKTPDGDVVGKAKPATRTVMSEQTAYYLTKMMEKVVSDGTGKRAQIGRPVAGKTGTTQMPDGRTGNKNAWFVGYTPDLVTSVHVGYDRTYEGSYLTDTGGGSPAAMFSAVMKRALKGMPERNFERPEGVKPLLPPLELKPVADLTAAFSEQDRRVDLTWTPIDEHGRVGYKVYKMPGGSEEPMLVGDTTETTFSDSDIPLTQSPEETSTLQELFDALAGNNKNAQISYFVVAYNLESGEEAEPSNVVPVTIPLLEVPSDDEGTGEGTDDGNNGNEGDGNGNDDGGNEDQDGNQDGNQDGDGGNDGDGSGDGTDGSTDGDSGDTTDDDQSSGDNDGETTPPPTSGQ